MKRYFFLLSLVLVLEFLATSCGSGGPKTSEVEDAMKAVPDAWQKKDVDKYLAAWTDKGLQEAFGATREEAKQYLLQSIGTQPFTFRKFSNTKISGNSATTEVEVVDGIVLAPGRFTLIKDGSVWKIDGEEHLTAEIPTGVTGIDLKLKEFAFEFDPSAITSGNIAFRVENVGTQPHEIALIKIPADLDLQQAIRSQEEPEGIEDVAYIGPQVPGTKTNIVFTKTLEAGRYALLCFIPDTDGQAHAYKGMVAEFTVK